MLMREVIAQIIWKINSKIKIISFLAKIKTNRSPCLRTYDPAEIILDEG